MTRPGFCHILASVLLLAATILFIVASVSAPVVNSMGILVVRLPRDVQGDTVTFGSFGHCVENGDNGDDICISSRVGYSPLDATRSLTTINGTTYVRTTARALTRVMVLHPIAAVLSFLAFLSALAAGVMGNSLACLFSTVASVVAALAMVSDFVLFGMVRAVVNQEWRGRGSARFGVAMWCVLAGAICAFVGTLGVLGACCTGRSRRRRRRDAEKAGVMTAAGSGAPAEAVPAHEAVEPKRPEEAPANGADGAPKPKRRFWKRG